MQIDAYCIECLIKRQMKQAQAMGGGEKGYWFLRDVMQAMLDAPAGVGAPYLVAKFDQAFCKYWHPEDRYLQIKKESNRFMLERLPRMRQVIAQSQDPLLTALKYAQTGNYIDFGALSDGVEPAKLDELLEQTPSNPLDPTEYANFVADLQGARRMVYLGDNAGEIVADMALVEVLKERFPDLSITFVVRGGPALNDVTREDAAAVGMDKLVTVVDSGVAIAGTEWSLIGPELRSCIESADVILSKGQGNFETFCPSGFPTYYMFLCKCERFTKLFDVPLLTGMFLYEGRMETRNPYC